MLEVKLYHRHYGIHTLQTSIEIDVEADLIFKNVKDQFEGYTVEEDLLISLLPKDFIPKGYKTSDILLTVEFDEWGKGLRNLTKFRPWAKYFDAYCISIKIPENFLENLKNPFTQGEK